MLWLSPNKKWKIDKVENKGNNEFVVHAEWITKNDPVTITLHNTDSDLGPIVVASSRPWYDLPKYIQKASIELVKLELAGKKEIAAAVAAPIEQTASLSTLTGLRQHAQNFLLTTYNMELEIPIKLNGRLTRSLGRFACMPKSKKSIEIDISKKLLEHYPEDEIKAVLEHELVHYALFEQGKPYRDGHPYFESELARLEISSTNTILPKGYYHVYNCPKCEKTVARKRSKFANPTAYRSKCCKRRIEYKGSELLK